MWQRLVLWRKVSRVGGQSRAMMGRVVTVAGRGAGHRLALWGKAFQAEGTIGAETLRENALKQE